MLLSFIFLSINIIVGLASANPVEITPQYSNDINHHFTDLVIQDNSFRVFQENIGALTGYTKSILSFVGDVINWLFSNIPYLITAAIVSFCRLTNLCMGLDQYLPQTRMVIVAPEYLETAEKFLITTVQKYLQTSSL